ncbi:Uncharacterised protein [Mycobacteroides abscessus subsp. abscessus]|nr:Uncharacterised protein [Mycobacteroides abscessus subsp. abscessus]
MDICYQDSRSECTECNEDKARNPHPRRDPFSSIDINGHKQCFNEKGINLNLERKGHDPPNHFHKARPKQGELNARNGSCRNADSSFIFIFLSPILPFT